MIRVFKCNNCNEFTFSFDNTHPTYCENEFGLSDDLTEITDPHELLECAKGERYKTKDYILMAAMYNHMRMFDKEFTNKAYETWRGSK